MTTRAPLCMVIDDERSFVPRRDAVVVYYRTVGDALTNMVQLWNRQMNWGHEMVDELWFDHDLGDGGDINIIIDWLVVCARQGNHFPVKNIYVHSQNPVGADNIVRKLQGFYRVTRTALPELERT